MLSEEEIVVEENEISNSNTLRMDQNNGNIRSNSTKAAGFINSNLQFSTSYSHKNKYFNFSVINSIKQLFSLQFVWIWGFILLALVLAVLFTVFHNDIIPPLVQFCDFIKSQGFFGGLLMTITIVISTFPPLVGYGSLLYMCGFIYGFPLGFIPAYLGGCIGGILVFLVSRKWLLDYWKPKLLANFPLYFREVEDAVEKGGLKLAILK